MLQQRTYIFAALALLLMGILATLLMVFQASRAAERVEHTVRVQSITYEILALATDAETGHRGYLLTNDPSYLAPYKKAMPAIAERTALLLQLTADNPEQTAILTEAAKLLDQRIEVMAQSIALASDGKMKAATDIVRSNRGKQLMDAVRERIAAFLARENTLYVERESAAAWLRYALIGFVMATLAGAVALTALITKIFRSQISELDARVRQRTEQLEFVTKELAHRSKNLMGIFQSTVNLTARNVTSVEDMRTALSARISGLARSQDVLLGHNFSGGDLSDLVRSHLTSFADGNALEISGPSVLLTPPAVQAIGFALHELGTNAAKYGALSVPAGKVRVAWTVDDGRVALAWSEHGGPPVKPPQRQGFGTSVTGAMTERSLRAKVAHEFLPQGFRWTIDFPLDPVTV